MPSGHMWSGCFYGQSFQPTVLWQVQPFICLQQASWGKVKKLNALKLWHLCLCAVLWSLVIISSGEIAAQWSSLLIYSCPICSLLHDMQPGTFALCSCSVCSAVIMLSSICKSWNNSILDLCIDQSWENISFTLKHDVNLGCMLGQNF